MGQSIHTCGPLDSTGVPWWLSAIGAVAAVLLSDILGMVLVVAAVEQHIGSLQLAMQQVCGSFGML